MTEVVTESASVPTTGDGLTDIKVPVVQVLASNMKEVWPSLIHSVKYSSFIAIDLVRYLSW